MMGSGQTRNESRSGIKESSIGRGELANAACRACARLDRTQARVLVTQVLEEIRYGLERDAIVKLSGFGVFKAADKAARIGRNPITGERNVISARKSVQFKACTEMRAAVAANSAAHVYRDEAGTNSTPQRLPSSGRVLT